MTSAAAQPTAVEPVALRTPRLVLDQPRLDDADRASWAGILS